MKQSVDFNDILSYLEFNVNGKHNRRKKELLNYLIGVQKKNVPTGDIITIGKMIEILCMYSEIYTLNYFGIQVLQRDNNFNFFNRCSVMHYDDKGMPVSKDYEDTELCNCLWETLKYVLDYVLIKEDNN